MGSDSQALKQARKLIGQLDFGGAIELLSPIDDPTPDEAFALAESYFLKATSTEDGRKSRAAYRKAIKLFPHCYRDCANPRMACRECVTVDDDGVMRECPAQVLPLAA